MGELTVFIRHNWQKWQKEEPELNEIVIPQLYTENKIGIHFQSKSGKMIKSDALNPNNYDTTGRKMMELMIKMAQNGALVFATYKMKQGNMIKLGKIRPQELNLWEYKDGFFIKMLGLSEVKEPNAPILLAIQPTQRTMVEWSKNPAMYEQKINILKHLHLGSPLPLELSSLIPAQQEVLCYEYMREKNIIRHLLLPIGRTLEDIDIFGIDNSRNDVFAQVTFSDDKTKIDSKIEALEKWKKQDASYYFFLKNCSEDTKKSHSDINFLLMGDVFDYFKEKEIIKKMINA